MPAAGDRMQDCDAHSSRRVVEVELRRDAGGECRHHVGPAVALFLTRDLVEPHAPARQCLLELRRRMKPGVSQGVRGRVWVLRVAPGGSWRLRKARGGLWVRQRPRARGRRTPLG